tara:strand:- start:1131 stop:2513 length:1383 start_codon:yes stop_codon:yes gene_type:complete
VIIKKFKISLLFFSFFLNVNTSFAQEKNVQKNRILFIFDASNSMKGKWQSGKKIDIAKKLLNNLVDSLKDIKNLEIGLRVYGHRSSYNPPNCDDTKLEVDFVPANMIAEEMKKKLNHINAQGTTPIGKSLREGAKDFEKYTSDRNIIILITDGKEECDDDPCEVSKELQKKGIILKPFVIGVGNNKDNWKKTLGCVGTFFDAQKEEEFSNILEMVITQIVDKTTTQVNLLDIYEEPTETNINLTFYNSLSGKAKYNYIHKINSKGNPDTMVIDHLISYKIVAHTIPPVIIDSVQILHAEHNIIGMSTPQGKLEIKTNTRKPINVIIKEENKDTTLHVQEANTTEDYIVGNYDLEILTIPRFKEKIKIEQNKTTRLKIPTPAIMNIALSSKGFGGIYLFNTQSKEWNQVFHFRNDQRQYKLSVLPGKYKVVYRANTAKGYIYTKEYDTFILKEGDRKYIKL